jgi:hypothetical protein
MISLAAGVFLAMGLWAQAQLVLQKKAAKFAIGLKYLGLLLFLGALWFYPPGVILDTMVFFLAVIGSLLLGGFRRKFKRYSKDEKLR